MLGRESPGGKERTVIIGTSARCSITLHEPERAHLTDQVNSGGAPSSWETLLQFLVMRDTTERPGRNYKTVGTEEAKRDIQ